MWVRAVAMAMDNEPAVCSVSAPAKSRSKASWQGLPNACLAQSGAATPANRPPAGRSRRAGLKTALPLGVAASLRSDPQAKSLGEYLRAKRVPIPISLLTGG
jgi:hypothetical protein